MVKSRAQQAYLAINKPKVLHELSGGHIAKGLPKYAKSSKLEAPEEPDEKKRRIARMNLAKKALGG